MYLSTVKTHNYMTVQLKVRTLNASYSTHLWFWFVNKSKLYLLLLVSLRLSPSLLPELLPLSRRQNNREGGHFVRLCWWLHLHRVFDETRDALEA